MLRPEASAQGGAATGAAWPLPERRECKYALDPAAVDPVRAFIHPFVEPDPYAAQRPGNRYPVCSLYLDTPALTLYGQTLQGQKNRYKLRVRSYSDDPGEPVFWEVKRRIDGLVLKRRTCVGRNTARALLDGRPHGNGDPVADEFLSLVAGAAARPTLRVRYQREAYESRGPDPVRLTFDTQLAYAQAVDLIPEHNGSGWRPAPLRATILEIKFTDRFPRWVLELLRSFCLGRQSLPKYCLSLSTAIRAGDYEPGTPCELLEL